MKALANGNHDLTLALYKRTLKGEDNQMISGFSVRQAFGMLYAGAKGRTETEISEAMRFDPDQAKLHRAFNALDLALASRNAPGAPASNNQPALDPISIYNGNRLWLSKEIEVKPTYLDTLAINYGAGVERLDFESAPEPSRALINQWVEHRTNQRIKTLLPEGSVRTETTAVLTNAVYFKAPWQYKFEDGATRLEPFATLAVSEKVVETMHQGGNFDYAEGEGWQAVQLPYRKGELSMIVILPTEGRFAEFESTMTSEQLEGITDQLAPDSVQLALPKWTFETSVELDTPLKSMGMTTTFDAPDLSGMMQGDFRITGVFHKTFVSVDEGGTEAAAATAVVVAATSVPVYNRQFVANRPFLFIIRDVATDTWLFFGRVSDPS